MTMKESPPFIILNIENIITRNNQIDLNEKISCLSDNILNKNRSGIIMS